MKLILIPHESRGMVPKMWGFITEIPIELFF